jgi:hypothetical protein
MKTLNTLINLLLVTLMLISVIQMFFYSSTLEHFALCWTLLMLSGVGALIHVKTNQSTK